MKKGTTFVALDDSKRKLVVGILQPGAEEPEVREIPNEAKLLRRLFERLRREGPVAACYEAGVSGYDLDRQITGLGVACQVIAPALTPRRPGQRIKTDTRDAKKLVRLVRAGELTAIRVPAEAEEGVRDFVRCREDVRRDVGRWRHRVVKFLDRHGRRYVAGRNWTGRHWTWLRSQRFEIPARQRTLEVSLHARASVGAAGGAGPGDRGPGPERALSGAGRVAALLPGHRHAGGHDPARRDRGLSPLPAAPGADGLPGAGAQRALLGRA